MSAPRRAGTPVPSNLTTVEHLTREASAALRRAGFSRRRFLKDSGALIVGFTVADRLGVLSSPAKTAAFQAATTDPLARLDSWIAIAADGSVTAFVGKCELGQGISTAQTQLVAEELSVPLSRVRLIYCDTASTPDQGTTSGDESHRTNFRDANLARAAATAREALVKLAATRLGAPSEQLMVADGVVTVKAAPSRRISYGELVGGRRFELALDETARRKPHGEWTVLGKPVPRVDMPMMVTGALEYVHHVRRPGMLHGAVVRPPTVGATLSGVDDSSVKSMPGFVRVVVKQNFVGIVAEKPWQAVQIARGLKASWTPGPALPSHRNYYDFMRTQPSQDTIWVDSGDVDAKLASAAAVLKSTYLHPYQMHASMTPSCAVADVRSDGATIWAATQNVYGLRSNVSKLLGLGPEQVRVIFTRGAGCYGINGVDAAALDATLLSQAAGRPVRVQLARRDEMAWENYGTPMVMNQRVGLDRDGTIVAWDVEGWMASRGGRIGMALPGNIVTGTLLGFRPAAFTPGGPTLATAPFNDRNDAPVYVTGCVNGECSGSGTVAGERAIVRRSESQFFTGPLRSPNHLQNTFAHESFMDEIAAHAKADPVAYRLRHLRDPRLIACVNAAAKAAQWDARPSPQPRVRRNGVASGRGIACTTMEAGEHTNGWIAMVAFVEVDQESGAIAVKRLCIGHDCGPISNPDGLRNQLEGAALQALSRAMTEEVTWDNEKITSVDWATYPILSLGHAMPAIDVVLIDRPDRPATGAGETASTVVAAAVGNAVFDATGIRLRQVPFTRERVKEALAART